MLEEISGQFADFAGTLRTIFHGEAAPPVGEDLKVEAHIASVGKALGDEITVRGFVRFQVGEA